MIDQTIGLRRGKEKRGEGRKENTGANDIEMDASYASAISVLSPPLASSSSSSSSWSLVAVSYPPQGPWG